MKYKELSANTVAFISCRRRLTKVLAGAARGEKQSKSGGSFQGGETREGGVGEKIPPLQPYLLQDMPHPIIH